MKQVDFEEQELAVLMAIIRRSLALQIGNGDVHNASHLLRKLENAEPIEPPGKKSDEK